MHRTSSRPALRTAALAVLAALAALFVSAGPASAHSELASSDPANGASLATGPSRITLTFNESPNATLATITVVGADGTRYEQGPATVADKVISVGVGPLGAAGAYEVGYRIVSGDGHPINGRLTFTLTAAGPAAAAAAPAAAPSAPATPADPPPNRVANLNSNAMAGMNHNGTGTPAWPFILTGVVVVVGAAAFVVRRRSVNA